jgi:hypothetical protein
MTKRERVREQGTRWTDGTGQCHHPSCHAAVPDATQSRGSNTISRRDRREKRSQK